MGKVVLFLGLVTGAAMFAIALTGAPAAGGVPAREAQPAAAGCHVEEFALDEGSDVSRKAVRPSCASAV